MIPENGSNKEVTLDDLAVMVKGGFDDLGERVGNLEKKVEKGFKETKGEIDGVQLRLDNVPYRFEFTELQKRVEALEKR